MSFFEYQYGDRREPKGAYALCCHAIKTFLDRHVQRVVARDPDDAAIPEAMRKIPRKDAMYTKLMLLHDRLIENRITSNGRIAANKSAQTFCATIVDTLLDDFIIFELALNSCTVPWQTLFNWLYYSRRELAELLRYIRIRYLIVDIKYNFANKRLIAELIADWQKMKEMEQHNLIGPHNFLGRLQQLIEIHILR